MSCSHLSSKDYSSRLISIEEKIGKEENFFCHVCKEDSATLWLCLHENCGYIGCERDNGAHFVIHTEEKKHFICCYLDDQTIVCLRCGRKSAEKKNFLVQVPWPKGLCGLTNMGNTCYMSAAIQSLSNCSALTQFFLRYEKFIQPPGKGKLSVAAEYHRLIKDLWSPERPKYITPSALARSFRHIYPQFSGYSQQDSQDFLRYLMDRLHEELKKPIIVCKKSPHPNQKSNFNHQSQKLLGGNNTLDGHGVTPTADMEVSYNDPESTPSKENETEDRERKEEVDYHSIISDVFNGKLTSSVQCLTCHRISTKVENFQDLSLPIPGKEDLLRIHNQCSPNGIPFSPDSYQQGWLSSINDWLRSWFVGPQVSLQDCLAAFFAKDELTGENMYNCEKCNKLRNGVKYLRLFSLPETLCIHLKRFRHEMSYSTKINSFVMFPVNGLDLKNFIGPDCTSQYTTYDLCAVITHFGSFGGGHYIAYAKNCVSNKWYEFNDSLVSEVSEYKVENAEAYCLFYTKRCSSDLTFRALVREKVYSCSPSRISDGVYVSREWLTRFETCCEPGQISNYDFLCRHGDVSPKIMPEIKKYVTLIPRDLWQGFHSRFGGGPEVTRFDECRICKVLSKRRQEESSTFTKFNEEFQKEQDPELVYCLSINWYKRWNEFTKGENNDPPGPIDNSDIAEKKGNNIVLKEDSEHGLISKETWMFFQSQYGGGPELSIERKQKPGNTQGNNSGESNVNNAVS